MVLSVDDPWQVSSIRVNDSVLKQVKLVVNAMRGVKNLDKKIYTRPCIGQHLFYAKFPVARRDGTWGEHTWRRDPPEKICCICWRVVDPNDPALTGEIDPKQLKHLKG